MSTPWYHETLEAMTEDAAADDLHGRLTAMARVARGFNEGGQVEKAQGIALGLIPMAFGVGYRKDYQFSLLGAVARPRAGTTRWHTGSRGGPMAGSSIEGCGAHVRDPLSGRLLQNCQQ